MYSDYNNNADDRKKNKDGIMCQFCDFFNNVDEKVCSICEGDLRIDLNSIGVKQSNITKRPGNPNSKNVQKVPREPDIDDDEDQIMCQDCYFFNKIDAETCHACNADLVDPKQTRATKPVSSKLDGDEIEVSWKCPSCTFKNKWENEFCDVCTTNGESVKSVEGIYLASIVGLSTNTWKCNSCQHENLFDKYSCTACKKYAPFVQKWVCGKCSFINAEWLKQCEVCNEGKSAENAHENLLKADLREDMKMRRPGKKAEEWEVVAVTECISCGKLLNSNQEILCQGCSDRRWYCCNKFCATVVYKSLPYCPSCYLKRGCNIKELKWVEVFQKSQFVKMRQCLDCGTFCPGDFCEKCEKTLPLSVTERLMDVTGNLLKSFNTEVPKIANWLNHFRR